MQKNRLLIISLLFTCTELFPRIGHECGIAMVRLLKPIEYYKDTYGESAWGLRSLCLLMEEQRNRGQDGAGIAAVKFDMPPGNMYMHRIRFTGQHAIEDVFSHVFQDIKDKTSCDKSAHTFLAEAYIGHVRYGTFGAYLVHNCQPYLFKNNVASKQFALAGNFNMANSQELFNDLIQHGLTLTSDTDTQVILEHIRYRLDQEYDYLSAKIKYEFPYISNQNELNKKISHELDVTRILKAASYNWDGGYVFGGLIGNGDMFICRDPAGIRPGFYFLNQEVFAAASERAALCGVFNCEPEEVQPIPPGHIIVLKKDNSIKIEQFAHLLESRQCSFERIYFSQTHDPDIYKERKRLGALLAKRVLDLVNWNVEHVVFTYIPNSSSTAFTGLIEEVQKLLEEKNLSNMYESIKNNTCTYHEVNKLACQHVRAERLVYKNQTLRTFISEDSKRPNLIARLYDMVKGIVKPIDTLVVVDDSIVRGTTLRHSVITQLINLNPKNIIIVSSAPPVKYPDCYGIDMSEIGKFIIFQAAVEIHKENGTQDLLQEVATNCTDYLSDESAAPINYVQKIYQSIDHTQLENKVAQMIQPENCSWHGDVNVIYQTPEGLRAAIPNHTGDWVFTGNYPTKGGFRVVHKSYLQWTQGINKRAY